MATQTKRRIIWMVSIGFGVVLLVAFVGPLIPYKRVANLICPISGSTRREITWFGWVSQEERTVSALERWLKRKEPSFEPQWHHMSTQTYYILSRACGTGGTPAIYQLRPILDGVVEKLDDAKIAGLVAVLRHGSGDEQSQAIRRISDDYFNSE